MLTLNYAPEMVGIGRYSSELAAWLAARGHQVTVLTAPPYYPQWQVQKPYRNGFHHEYRDGVEIRRAPIWVPQQPSAIQRLLHLATFAISSLLLLAQQLDQRPDRLVVIAPAFFCTVPALLYRSVCHWRGQPLRCWLHIQDFELDAAYALGLLRYRWLRRLAERIERAILQRFDVVSSLTGAMLHKLRHKGVPEAALRLFPNWVHCDDYGPVQTPSERQEVQALRAELGIPGDAVVALYAGSMGRKQGLEVLAEAARCTRHDPNLWWVLCGTGPGARGLQQLCGGLAQVLLLPLQPAERYRVMLQLADLHLLPQLPGAADLLMPSKLLAMLASGRPVVATAAAHTELGRVLEGNPPVGVRTPPGDAQGLAAAVRQLARDDDRRARLGAQARRQARLIWDRDAVLSRFEQDLQHLDAASQPQWIRPMAPSQVPS